MVFLKNVFRFLKSSLIIILTTFLFSLLIDFFYGKKILNLLDGYLIKTEFYDRILRVDSLIYHHGLKPNVNYKKNVGFEGKFTFCTNNYGFRDNCNKKIINKDFDIGFMGD